MKGTLRPGPIQRPALLAAKYTCIFFWKRMS